MKMITMLACALGLAVAKLGTDAASTAQVAKDTDIMGADLDGDPDNLIATVKAEQTSTIFAIFHINLSWECAALPDRYTGAYASVHCKPGKFGAPRADGDLYEWVPDTPAVSPIVTYINSPPQLVTSCQNTFLKQMREWNGIRNYDVVTLVELRNTDPESLSNHLGIPIGLIPELVGQLVDHRIYESLTKFIFGAYRVFANYQPPGALQATFYKKSTFEDKLFVGVAFDMVKDKAKYPEARPVSALFFVDSKRLVLNIHSTHFRKQLIKHQAKLDAYFGEDMDAIANKKLTSNDVTKFNLLEFPTGLLQDLYGEWLTKKIKDALTLCQEKAKATTVSTNVYTFERGYCREEGPNALASASVLQTTDWTGWNIFAAGDFNDETMELSKFKIFGRELSIEPNKRKRTCCSDRDEKFKKIYLGTAAVSADDAAKPGECSGSTCTPLHTKANTDYMEDTCQYTPKNQLGEWLKKNPNSNAMKLSGAYQYAAGSSERSESSYPFPSDNIVSTIQSPFGIEFPTGYAENMSAVAVTLKPNPEKPDQWLTVSNEISTYNGMISDHDPIERMFIIPQAVIPQEEQAEQASSHDIGLSPWWAAFIALIVGVAAGVAAAVVVQRLGANTANTADVKEEQGVEMPTWPPKGTTTA